MTMMFEVQDLAVASPATVSRCGMVYLEPSILGLRPFVNCWMHKLPDCIFEHREKLQSLFDRFLEASKAVACCPPRFKSVFATSNCYFLAPHYLGS